MNTIPLIFNERQIQRTVLGGKNIINTGMHTEARIPCSLVLLNRGSNHYRQQNIASLLKIGFSEIISVESSSLSYNLEDFAHRHPQVKFVVPHEYLSTGEMLNIGITESSSDFVLVIWNDVHITQSMISNIVYEKLISEDILCMAPLLQSSSLQTLPVKMTPSIEKSVFSAFPSIPVKDKEHTVYPFDFMGLYNRQKFMQLGGFDYTITNSYWQNLDFSLRAWLWGEKIKISTQLKLKYEDESPLEDTTADFTQLRFFLKNCAPTFKYDYSYIPISRYFSFRRNFPGNPFEALKTFKDARKWVAINKYRFKVDIANLVKTWHVLFDDNKAVDSK